MTFRVAVFALMFAGVATGAFAADAPKANAAGASGNKPYTVTDGNKVDESTLKGWKTWRAQACERCHGAQQEGGVGPSLVDSLKRLTKEEFNEVILKGRIERGMPNFSGAKMVVDNLDGLYGYLKGRSDGAIKPGRLEAASN